MKYFLLKNVVVKNLRFGKILTVISLQHISVIIFFITSTGHGAAPITPITEKNKI